MGFKILHMADLHFSNIPEKLEEVINVTNYILSKLPEIKPDVIVVAGDSLDEYDGRIKLDSDTARAAMCFIQNCGNIAPVVVVRGTKSHDRESPYFFGYLRAKHPIYVGDKIGQIALTETGFKPISESNNPVAVFSLVPELDKSEIIANGNIDTKEYVSNIFTEFGVINKQFTCPRVMVAHGTVTGAQYSNEYVSVGNELEFSINDLKNAHCHYVALGHIHKMQSFDVNIYYSGSPGRLNAGEKEDKGFLVARLDGQKGIDVKFHETPARKLCVGVVDIDEINKWVETSAETIKDAYVHLKISVPEEKRHEVDKNEVERCLMNSGAHNVKVEVSIIPQIRQRAAGISKLSSILEKIKKWGETVNETIPDEVIQIVSGIEGKDVEELVAAETVKIEGICDTLNHIEEIDPLWSQESLGISDTLIDQSEVMKNAA